MITDCGRRRSQAEVTSMWSLPAVHPNQSSSLEVCCLVYFSWDAMYNGGGNIEPSFLKSIMKSWFLLLSNLVHYFLTLV